MSSGQFGNQLTADVVGVERDDAIGPDARNRQSFRFEAGAGRPTDWNNQPRQIFVNTAERQLKHHFLGAGLATNIYFELDGFAQPLLQQLSSGALILKSFSQFRHTAGPFARLESAALGVVAREAPAVLYGLRLINLFDQLRTRRRFAPALEA